MTPIPVFDAHCDTISRVYATGESIWKNSGMVELANTSRSFSRYCQFFALFADSKRLGHPTYEQLLSCFRQKISEQREHISHCRNADEAQRANQEGKAAAFLSVEGAELLNCDPRRLERAAADGVIAINLTWNNANALSGSCRAESDRGLSSIGYEFVRRMEELGILADVSHLSDRGFFDLMEMVQKPVIASHSNARSVWSHARNLTDEQITVIIKNQGVIGINFYRDFIGLSMDYDAVRRHLDHILDLGGEAQIALGGDWDGCDTIDSLSDITRLTDLYEYLLSCGYREELLRDIYYNNLMRVVRER